MPGTPGVEPIPGRAREEVSPALTASFPSHFSSPVGPGGWRGLTGGLVPSCCGHSARFFHPRDEEEDKMVEAMIRNKGKTQPEEGASTYL